MNVCNDDNNFKHENANEKTSNEKLIRRIRAKVPLKRKQKVKRHKREVSK